MISRRILFAALIWIAANLPYFGIGESPSNLKIDKPSIHAGQSAVITWKVEADQKAYVLGIGRVSGTGSIEVKPSRSMVYTLVKEGPQGISVQSAAIEVSGGRGQEDTCKEDDESRFRYPISFDVHSASLVDLLDRVHRVLQDDLTFTVDASQTPNKLRFLYVTNCSQRGNLVQPTERQIGARRIAYRVEIGGPESLNAAMTNRSQPLSSAQGREIVVSCKISTLVEFKRKIESTWRTGDREAIHQTAARDLESRLTQAH